MVVCCGIVGRGACTQSLLVSVLLVYYSLFLSSRDFSGLTPQLVTVEQQLLALVCYVSVALIKKIAKRTRISTFD